MEETSLDDFLDDGEESTAGESLADADVDLETPDAETEPGTEADPEPGDTTAEPATQEPATARWTPDGEACEDCGETVTRLWDDDGRRVCRSCKHW